MDTNDLVLIEKLAEDGRSSLEKIGNEIGISRVAVTKRLKKLKESGILKIGAMLNLNMLGFDVIFIRIEVANYEDLQKLVEIYKNCPRIIWLIHAAGGYNLLVAMYAEDQRTLMSILDGCSIRTRKEVRRSEVSVGRLILPKYVPITLVPGADSETAPCGLSCGSCNKYLGDECLGCPSTKFYNPNWLKTKKRRI